MQERSKRLLSIVLFLGSAVVIGLAIYVVFFSEPPTTTPATPEQPIEDTGGTAGLSPSKDGAPGSVSDPSQPGGSLPQASEVASGGLTQTTALTTGPIQNPAPSTNGDSIHFYNDDDGKFYTIDKDGNIVKRTNQSFPDVESVTWNNGAEKAILTFPDDSKIVYNFTTQSQVTLPKHWEDVNFSPVADSLIAKSVALDPNNRWIVLSNDNGSNVVPVQALGENADKVQINWSPNDQVIAFADTSSVAGGGSTSFDTRVIYPVGKNQENYKGLVVEGFGFAPSWSPSGKTLLYSVYSDYSQNKPLLWLVNATSSSMGENRHSLSINTWADKCTWHTDTELYCAVPQTLPPNAGLQRSLFDTVPDTLYKLDLETGRNTIIAIPEREATMKNLSVSKDASLLYYTSAQTGQLNLIKLK